MNKKKEIESKIQNIWYILIIAKDCFQYSFSLHRADTQEEQEYLNRSEDFQFIRHIFWRTTVMELSKLFSTSNRNDQFNISNFINNLKRGQYYGDIGISEETISLWENNISINNDTITKILGIRNNIYAHTNKNKKKYINSDLTFQQIEQLIQIVEGIIKEIYFKVFDAEAAIDTGNTFDKSRFNDIIKILATEKRKEIEKILSGFSNTKTS